MSERVCPNVHTVTVKPNDDCSIWVYTLSCGDRGFATTSYKIRQYDLKTLDSWKTISIKDHLIEYLNTEIDRLEQELENVHEERLLEE